MTPSPHELSLCSGIGTDLDQGLYERFGMYFRVKDNLLIITAMLILGCVCYGIPGNMLGKGKTLGS
jgi:hypothetical protein